MDVIVMLFQGCERMVFDVEESGIRLVGYSIVFINETRFQCQAKQIFYTLPWNKNI